MVDSINVGVSILIVLGSIPVVDSTTSYAGRYPTQTCTVRFTMMVTPLALTEKSTVQLGGPEITFKGNDTIAGCKSIATPKQILHSYSSCSIVNMALEMLLFYSYHRC